MKTPRIALVADRKLQTAGAWVDVPTDGLPHSYLSAIEQAGGMAMLIPALQVNLDNAPHLLQGFDGLFLPGGRDVDADLYGEDAHTQNDQPLRIRDDLEIALVREARKMGMPIFGACRGMQVINVALGGSLTQHLDEVTDMTPHRDRVGEFTSHVVHVRPDSRLASLVPAADMHIASHHHQGVKELGRGLLAAAVAPDGIVEAVEVAGDDFCIGVQWHPEEQLDVEGLALVRAFIDAAREFGTTRALQPDEKRAP